MENITQKVLEFVHKKFSAKKMKKLGLQHELCLQVYQFPDNMYVIDWNGDFTKEEIEDEQSGPASIQEIASIIIDEITANYT